MSKKMMVMGLLFVLCVTLILGSSAVLASQEIKIY